MQRATLSPLLTLALGIVAVGPVAAARRPLADPPERIHKEVETKILLRLWSNGNVFHVPIDAKLTYDFVAKAKSRATIIMKVEDTPEYKGGTDTFKGEVIAVHPKARLRRDTSTRGTQVQIKLDAVPLEKGHRKGYHGLRMPEDSRLPWHALQHLRAVNYGSVLLMTYYIEEARKTERSQRSASRRLGRLAQGRRQ